MPTTLRQAIFDALITRLKTITTAAGYNTAIGTKVDEWRTDYESIIAEEMPRLNVRDETAAIEQATLGNPIVERHIRVSIEGFVSAASTTLAGDGARGLLGDLEKVIFNDQTLGATCRQIRVIGESPIVVGQAKKTIAVCELQIEIEYHSNGFNDYTLVG